jgi:hypothetical protein
MCGRIRAARMGRNIIPSLPVVVFAILFDIHGVFYIPYLHNVVYSYPRRAFL